MSQEPVPFEKPREEVQYELPLQKPDVETEASQSANHPYSQGSGDSGGTFR